MTADNLCRDLCAPSAILNDSVAHNLQACSESESRAHMLSQTLYTVNYLDSLCMKSVLMPEDYSSFSLKDNLCRSHKFKIKAGTWTLQEIFLNDILAVVS